MYPRSYRQWVTIVDRDDPRDSGPQGYVKLSLSAIGPGDRMRVHDLERECEEEGEVASEMGALVPPSMPQELQFLVVDAHRATHLCAMDSHGKQGGIDAYLKVWFANGAAARTKVRTAREIGRNDGIAPTWNEQIWLPVYMPTMARRLTVQLWDRDLAGDELVATAHLDINAMPRGGPTGTPFWVNLCVAQT